MLMVTVSIAAGPLTYLVTVHASEATEVEDGRLQDTAEDGYLGRTVQATLDYERRTFLAYERHDALYQAHVAASKHEGADVAHEFGAQSEHDQLLAVQGEFRWGFPTVVDGRLEYPETVAREALEAGLYDGRLKELSTSSASATKAVIDHSNAERMIALALIRLVIAFVGSLLLLTAALVTTGRLRSVFVVAGVVLALAAAAAVVAVDGSPLAWAVGAGTWLAYTIIAIVVVARRRIRRLHESEIAPDDTGELIGDTGTQSPGLFNLPDPGEMGSVFSRAVAIAIAAGTLCGAWVGYLQADAFGRSDAHRVAAHESALNALVLGEKAEGEILLQMETYRVATESVVAMWGAQQFARFAKGTDGAPAADIALEQARTMAEAVDDEVGFGKAEFGPAQDPDYPIGLIADAAREHDKQVAYQVMHDSDSRDWEGRGNFYVRWLVVLAIAVYLLGLAVVIPGVRVKELFLVAGAGGVILASGVTLWTLINHPRSAQDDAVTRRDTAAAAYSEGRFMLATGHIDEAVTAFTTATERRPDLTRAHAELATALFIQGSSQTDGYMSVSSKAAVEASIQHRKATGDAGSKSYTVQVDLGYESFLGSLQAADDATAQALWADSIKASTQATELVPDNPLPYFNLAVARLASGETAKADAAYDAAIRLTRAGEDRRGSSERLAILAGAVTDLEVLRNYRPDLDGVADRYQAKLIRELSGPQPLSGTGISSSEVTILELPTTLRWDAPLSGYQPSTDELVQVWFRRARSDEPWAVFEGVETIDLDASREQGSFALLFGPTDDDPDYAGELDVAATLTECLPAGDYRLDLFVNGVLAARSEPMAVSTAESGDAGTEGWWARDVGLFACIPTGWKPVAEDKRELGHVDARTDGSSGLVFARVHYGGAVDGSDRAAAVLESLRKTGLSVVPAGLDRDPDTPNLFFQGSRYTHTDVWRSANNEYRAQAAVTSSGTVVVAILFGPTGFLAMDGARAGPIGSTYIQMDELWGLRRPG